MQRRDFLLGSLAFAQQPRPNILFLFSDDHRFSALNALHHSGVKTPNLDKLVRGGTAFTQAAIMGGTIGAVCVPSRAMLMTGQTLFHIHDSIIAPNEAPHRARKPFMMFPEMFRKAGYTTFATGKWHNGPALWARCFSHGENIFLGGMSDHDKVPVHAFDPSGAYPKSSLKTASKFSSELFSDSAIAFLKNHKRGNPFLMYVAYTAPHDPRTPPKEYADMYPPAKIKLPPNFMPEHPFDNGEMKVRDEQLAPWPRKPETMREHIAAYYAMITHLDAQIGRVLTALEESGQAGNTIVVFAADNGLAVGQHGLLGKQNLYDHSVRVPLVFSGPGVPRGRTAGTQCYLLDIFPTLCNLTGMAVPSTVEGKSLAPALKNPAAVIRDSTLHAYRHVQRGVRTREWKLILYNVDGKQTAQLFHLEKDPWEIKNLADDARHAAKRNELTLLLKDWMKRAEDPLDIEKPNWGYRV